MTRHDFNTARTHNIWPRFAVTFYTSQRIVEMRWSRPASWLNYVFRIVWYCRLWLDFATMLYTIINTFSDGFALPQIINITTRVPPSPFQMYAPIIYTIANINITRQLSVKCWSCSCSVTPYQMTGDLQIRRYVKRFLLSHVVAEMMRYYCNWVCCIDIRIQLHFIPWPLVEENSCRALII